jgi:hypothetical protein
MTRLLLFAALAATASATTRPALFADLADRARALPAEFAADALLRIADAPAVFDIAWKREVLEDAFRVASGAQQPLARRNWTGKPGSLFDKAYAQGLDVCTLQCRAVHAMLAIDYKKARELFAEIPPPQIPRLTCDDALVYDPSIFYATAVEVAARAFNAKEIADEEPFHLLLRFSQVTSPTQIAPAARMLAGASLKPAQMEALTASLGGVLQQISGDDRSFSAALSDGADAAIAALHSQPLVDAWQASVARQLKETRCTDPQPAGQCDSPQCQQLAKQFSSLVVGPNGYGLTPEQKSTAEWGGKLRLFLAGLADWKDDNDPAEYFQFKTRFYSELYNQTPSGPERDLLLSAVLIWLQQNSYQRDHRVEWFYPVNTLIIHAPSMRDLRRSADPVIAFYSELEQLLPRPQNVTIGLL